MTKAERDRAPWETPRRLPTDFWGRVAVLWDFAPVPFFGAFDGEAEEVWSAGVEDNLRATEES